MVEAARGFAGLFCRNRLSLSVPAFPFDPYGARGTRIGFPSSSYSGVLGSRFRGWPALVAGVPFGGPGFLRSRPSFVNLAGGFGGGAGLAATSATSACANSSVVRGRLGPAPGVSIGVCGSSTSDGSINDDPTMGGIPAGSERCRPVDGLGAGGSLDIGVGGVGVGAGAGVGLLGGTDALDCGRGGGREGRGALSCRDGLFRGRGALEANGDGEGRAPCGAGDADAL